MVHVIKSWPEYFQPIWDQDRKFDVRKDDRGYSVGDALRVEEYDPLTKKYTGRKVTAEVTYILKESCAAIHSFGDVVVLSIDVLRWSDNYGDYLHVAS